MTALGAATWWGTGPYASFDAGNTSFRLFEIIPAPATFSLVALAAAVLVAAAASRRSLLPRAAAWYAGRGARRYADAVVALGVVATLGFYPRNRAVAHMLVDGFLAFPNDVVKWGGLAAFTAGFAIVLMAWAPAVPRRAAALWDRVAALPPGRFLAGACLLALASSACIALLWFNGEPIATDGVNYRFQANIFAHGHFTLPPPPQDIQFRYVSVIVTPRWRSIVNPGWPMLLMLGVRASVPWLMNPLCHAGGVALLYALGRRWWNDRTGRAAALLGVVSPFLLLPAGSHMSHTSALFALLLFLWLWTRMAEGNGARWALAAGLVLGWAALIRPLDAAAFALPCGVWTLVRAARRRLTPGAVVALGIGVTLPLVGLGCYNWVVNGSPTTFGYDLFYEGKLKLGFGSAPDLTYTPYPHTPARGLLNTNNGLNALNAVLLGWPVPALAVAAVALRARGRDVHDLLCAAAAAMIVGVYFLFVHADFMFGPRYYHAAAGVLLLLAVRGLFAIAAAVGREWTAAGLVACAVFAAGGWYPPLLRFYRPDAPVFQGVQTRLTEALAAEQPTQALVLIDAGTSLAYGGGVWRNGAGAESDIVFARVLGNDAAIRRALPNRAVYRYRPDSDPPRLERLQP